MVASMGSGERRARQVVARRVELPLGLRDQLLLPREPGLVELQLGL